MKKKLKNIQFLKILKGKYRQVLNYQIIYKILNNKNQLAQYSNNLIISNNTLIAKNYTQYKNNLIKTLISKNININFLNLIKIILFVKNIFTKK